MDIVMDIFVNGNIHNAVYYYYHSKQHITISTYQVTLIATAHTLKKRKRNRNHNNLLNKDKAQKNNNIDEKEKKKYTKYT